MYGREEEEEMRKEEMNEMDDCTGNAEPRRRSGSEQCCSLKPNASERKHNRKRKREHFSISQNAQYRTVTYNACHDIVIWVLLNFLS